MAHAPGSDILPAHHRPTGQSADISLSDHAYDLGSVELSSLSTPDQQTLLRAVEDARRILGEYIDRATATQREQCKVYWPCSTRTRSCTPSIE
jgi:hypothetical protein